VNETSPSVRRARCGPMPSVRAAASAGFP
jgi:hypothetical protein